MGNDRWPGGQRLAVVFNVMYEQWAPGSHPMLGPMGNPLPPSTRDYQALSWSEYGQRTGIWSLLELFARKQVHATVYANGILSERAGDSLRAVVEAGHELCGHGWSQDLILPGLSAEDQRRDVEATTAALREATGVAPTGWISPRCTPSDLTAGLLAAVGYRWFGDVFDADLPYLLETGAGPITALPFGLDINDLPMLVRYGAPAREMTDTFHHLVAGLEREDHKAYIDVTVHAHVAARGDGRVALAEILEAAVGRSLWIATRGEIAEAHLS